LGILWVRIGSRRWWRGETLIGDIRSDVELPIWSERVGKRNVTARLTIFTIHVINDRTTGESHYVDFIILVLV
jgi:hypothetical protein